MRKVMTTRFGEIEVADDKIVRFEDGLPAFEDEHEFHMIAYDKESPYYFLQSMATPELAFLVVVPYIFFPEYEFRLDDEAAEQLGIAAPEDLEIYVLLTIPEGKIPAVTANLMAPVVVNRRTLAAKQVILTEGEYTTKTPLFARGEDA